MALEVPYRSIPDMFLKRVAATPDGQAFARADRGRHRRSVWLTWAQVGERAKAIAAGLHGLGVGLEDRVAILSGTRLEWVLVDLGINCAGGGHHHGLPHHRARGRGVHRRRLRLQGADRGEPAAGAEAGRRGHAVTHVVLIDGLADAARDAAAAHAWPSWRSAAAAALAEQPGPDRRDRRRHRPGQRRHAHLHLRHHRPAQGRRAAAPRLDLGGRRAGGPGPVRVRPTCSTCGCRCPTRSARRCSAASLHVGVPTYVDGRVDKLVDMLAVVQPDADVRGAADLREGLQPDGHRPRMPRAAPRPKIFNWAVATGKQKVALEQAGKPVPARCSRPQHALAEKLVFSKLQARLGGRLRVLVSGSAPLSRDIAEFFAAANLPIMEGYGLTETSAGNFVNRPGKLKIGTVGRPLGDLECRIDADGEVLLRGEPVMRGYHNLPEETEEAFTRTASSAPATSANSTPTAT